MPARQWTDDEVATLRRMRAQGASAREIGQALGRSKDAVNTRCLMLGIHMEREAVLSLKRRCMAEARAGNGETARALAVSRSYTPERRRAVGEQAKRLRLWEIGNAAQSPEGRARGLEAAAAARRRALAWCPPHLRADYRRLSKARIPSAEARRIISDEWAMQLRRALRQIADVARPLAEEQQRRRHSLEGQLERLRNGARLVERQPMRAAAHERSLTGNAWGMM